MQNQQIASVEDILDISTGYWQSAIMTAAFELHLADHLAAGRLPPRSLRARKALTSAASECC